MKKIKNRIDDTKELISYIIENIVSPPDLTENKIVINEETILVA